MKNKRNVTYKDAGVDTDTADEFVEIIKEIVRKNPSSKEKYVLSGIGGFAGAFDFGEYWRDYLIERYGAKKNDK